MSFYWVLVLLCTTIPFAFSKEPVKGNSLERVRRVVPSAELLAAPENPEKSIVGRYTIRHSLAGSDLYLFPDRSYIFTRWEDSRPVETIYDKGKWSFEESYVILSSDGSAPTKDAMLARKQLALTAQFKGNRELFLLDYETSKQFRDSIEDHGITHPKHSDMSLQFYFRRRTEALAGPQTEATKKRLMEKAWDPEYFRGER